LTYKLLTSSYLQPLVNKCSTSTAHHAHWDANLPNDSSTMSQFCSPQHIPFRARFFNTEKSYYSEDTSDAGYIEQITSDVYRPYLRVDRWTLETVGGLCLWVGSRFLLFEIGCDSVSIQTARTLSHPCRGI
jgi:hypothetical protein